MERFAITTDETVDLSLILRGLFASAVVFWHTLGAYHVELIPAWLNVPGRVSVWVFFGLSGYVIGHGFFRARYHWWGRGLGVYFARRSARILPLFWLVTACAILLALLLGSELPVEAGTMLPALFATQWSHSTYFVGVFWTLGLEIQFYIVAPVIAWGIIRSGWLWPLLLLSAWVVLWGTFSGDDRTTIGNLQHFLVGMAVAKAVTSGALERVLALPFIAPAGAVLGLLCIGIASHLYQGPTFWGGSGALWTDLAILALLVSHCAIERGVVRSNAVTRGLMALGVLAYGLYAWHGLLLTFAPSLTPFFPVVFVLSLAMAWLSYSLVERPIIAAAKRFTTAPQAQKREPEGSEAPPPYLL